MTPEETWRVGRKVPRNLYRGDEPIAMLATTDLASEIAEGMNLVGEIEDLQRFKEWANTQLEADQDAWTQAQQRIAALEKDLAEREHHVEIIAKDRDEETRRLVEAKEDLAEREERIRELEAKFNVESAAFRGAYAIKEQQEQRIRELEYQTKFNEGYIATLKELGLPERFLEEYQSQKMRIRELEQENTQAAILIDSLGMPTKQSSSREVRGYTLIVEELDGGAWIGSVIPPGGGKVRVTDECSDDQSAKFKTCMDVRQRLGLPEYEGDLDPCEDAGFWSDSRTVKL